MASRRFPILGGVVPPMLGREAILNRILGSLTKPTPDHLQLVGPRFGGKTVILHEVVRRLRKQPGPYTAFVLWDLGHQTPATDDLFLRRFAQELGAALLGAHPDYAKHLGSVQGNPYQDIAEVLDLLRDEGKVLAIMDGFHKPLSNGQLTRNLWDQLRELALKPSLRLVTASRRTLRDLIRHPDAQTSDFWNIFDPTPVRVGCFDDEDLTAVLGQLDGLHLAGGAITELWNETNGFPVLLLEVLNVMQEDIRTGEAKPDAVIRACVKVLPAMNDTLSTLWGECAPSSQDLLRRVIEEQTVARSGITNADAETLIERGFVHQAGNKLLRPSRLLTKFLEETPNEGNALVRLFGVVEAYQQHFKGVMERRISHLSGLDPTLKRYLERGAEDLPAHPEVFLSNVRGIVNQAFELIWKAELGERQIPSEWMATWKYNQERGVDDWLTHFPQGVHRVRLLNLMTGTEKSKPCAKHVTKNTYVLMNAAHAFGDFGQHQEGTTIDLGTGYAGLNLCIELAAALSRELPST